MKGVRLLSVLVLLVLGTGIVSAHAATYVVKPDSTGDFPTIQAALNAAMAGDTVRVLAGLYNESLFWPTRNGIRCIGDGMATTIVRGNGTGNALFATPSVADTTTVIRGLCFRNGGNAGVLFSGASPLLEACAIESTATGPGIQCANGSRAVIRNCEIRANPGSGVRIESSAGGVKVTDSTIRSNGPTADGGGVYIAADSVEVRENMITDNTASSRGGGVYVGEGAQGIVIAENEITDNDATYYGGGILFWGWGEITDNTIRGNRAVNQGGGGIQLGEYSTDARATIRGNRIVGNAAGHGGGLNFVGWTFGGSTIEENTVAENTAADAGGGLRFDQVNAATTVRRNAVVRNTAAGDGGGIFVWRSTALLTGNTVTENVAGGNGDGIASVGAVDPTISFSNIAWNVAWRFDQTRGQGLFRESGTSTPVARDNWWGHGSGPFHQAVNDTGKGDTASFYAYDVVPWLSEADTLAPPMPPVGVEAMALSCSAIRVAWNPLPLPDLAGYRVYADTDTSGPPYTTVIDVGNVTTYALATPACTTTTFIAVTSLDRAGNESWYSKETVDRRGTAVEASPVGPGPVFLGAATPNPFTTETAIRYAVPEGMRAAIAVYDVQGRRVATLGEPLTENGTGSAMWDGRDGEGQRVAPGVYLFRLETELGTRSAKAVLAR